MHATVGDGDTLWLVARFDARTRVDMKVDDWPATVTATPRTTFELHDVYLTEGTARAAARKMAYPYTGDAWEQGDKGYFIVPVLFGGPYEDEGGGDAG